MYKIIEQLHGLSSASRLPLRTELHLRCTGSILTKLALLNFVCDILLAADRGEVTLLGFLDLSAAFDTVDHKILLGRLHVTFGLRGQVLDWIHSFR